MRILIVSQYFWPEAFRINDLTLALKECGHEVTVLTGMPNYPSGNLFEGYSWWKKRRDDMHGVSVYRVPLFLRHKGRGWQLALNYFSFVLFGCLLAPWYFRKHAFDVIFVYEPSPFTVGIPAILMRWLKKAPILFWVQDLWPESLSATDAVQSPAILGLIGRMVRWIYQHCDKIAVQSRGFIEPAMKAGAKRENIVYFPNWAESLYQPVKLSDDAPERSEIPTDGFVVMFAGNLGMAQSLDTILDASEIMKDKQIYWVFLGDGRQRGWMQDQIKTRGLKRVLLLGRKPVETMPAYFSLADVMLVSLRTNPAMAATIPGKVQSYLACACPVIGALDGEGAHIIEEAGAGLVAAAGDSDALAKAVLEMYRMPETERQTMGEKGRGYYDVHFERDMLIARLEQWMQEVKEEEV